MPARRRRVLSAAGRWAATLVCAVMLIAAAAGIASPWAVSMYGLGRWDAGRGGYRYGVRIVFSQGGVEAAFDDIGASPRRWWGGVGTAGSLHTQPPGAWRLRWSPDLTVSRNGPGGAAGTWAGVYLPWWLLVGGGVAVAWWWRTCRTRPVPELCANCGYCLDGVPRREPCPECGVYPFRRWPSRSENW